MKLELTDFAEFTWLWGDEFFLETKHKGNFIWSSPDYNGSNIIRPYKGSYKQYLKEVGLGIGRDKGSHSVEGYCGSRVQILTEEEWMIYKIMAS